jgi:hypothetical protein
MQKKFREFRQNSEEFRPDWRNLEEIQMKFRQIQRKFRENSGDIQIFLEEILTEFRGNLDEI